MATYTVVNARAPSSLAALLALPLLAVPAWADITERAMRRRIVPVLVH